LAAAENDEGMNSRIRAVIAVLAVGSVLGPAVCGPYLPPTTVPAVTAFGGPKANLIRDALHDQNVGQKTESTTITISQMVAVPRVAPVLLETLPELPQQVEFAFSGRTLILRDVHPA
jgi:hypothetical protein